ncbi:Senescence regulator S40 [Dillenia turbinata]|uniref:Senescence regulator S40 n=1 Tax=Dillenia turbinata TaxID=194707 RepID=A0AAN8VYN2_9MAGN
MSSRKSYNHNFLYLSTNQRKIPTTVSSDETTFEFNESDIYATTPPHVIPTESKKPISTSRSFSKKIAPTSTTSSSLPVNIPDWSKTPRENYRESSRRRGCDAVDDDNDEEDDDEGDWIPPHEYLARTRTASLSVHEGIGRTLKGRDLSRVRNAIWKKVGFED